jgi:hypothetical protein
MDVLCMRFCVSHVDEDLSTLTHPYLSPLPPHPNIPVPVPKIKWKRKGHLIQIETLEGNTLDLRKKGQSCKMTSQLCPNFGIEGSSDRPPNMILHRECGYSVRNTDQMQFHSGLT